MLRVLVGIQLLLLPATLAVFPLRGPANPWPGGDIGAGDVLRRIALDANSEPGAGRAARAADDPGCALCLLAGAAEAAGALVSADLRRLLRGHRGVSHAAFTAWVLGYVENLLAQEMPLALLFAMESAWTLFVMLLFGVVIVAWQYDMRHVLWYVLLLAGAELVALSPLLLSSLPWPPLLFQVTSTRRSTRWSALSSRA